jgi:MYXO-CTERM domain-containing protein
MRIATIAAAAALALSPAVVLAQTATDDATVTTTAPVENDDEFPWGLLGLLGLAGLAGLKRRDDHRVDVRRPA